MKWRRFRSSGWSALTKMRFPRLPLGGTHATQVRLLFVFIGPGFQGRRSITPLYGNNEIRKEKVPAALDWSPGLHPAHQRLCGPGERPRSRPPEAGLQTIRGGAAHPEA
jgi:hypothetical protein